MSQSLVTAAMRQQAEAADADEPAGEHVLHKPSQELADRECHPPPAMAVGIVLVAERDLIILQRLDPLVADRHPVRVAGQVLQRLLRSVVRWFGIYGPFFLIQRRQESRELLRVGQWGQATSPAQFPEIG